MTDATVKLLDLNDYELPLFSENRENEIGRPLNAQAFFNKIGNYFYYRHVNCLRKRQGR